MRVFARLRKFSNLKKIISSLFLFLNFVVTANFFMIIVEEKTLTKARNTEIKYFYFISSRSRGGNKSSHISDMTVPVRYKLVNFVEA